MCTPSPTKKENEQRWCLMLPYVIFQIWLYSLSFSYSSFFFFPSDIGTEHFHGIICWSTIMARKHCSLRIYKNIIPDSTSPISAQLEGITRLLESVCQLVKASRPRQPVCMGKWGGVIEYKRAWEKARQDYCLLFLSLNLRISPM